MLGRAVAGLGNAVVITGGFAILVLVFDIERRAVFNSLILMT